MDSSINNDMDLSKLKVPELRKELKIRGLNTSGNKNELLDRLQGAIKDQKADDTIETGSVDDLDEDLLNEDDDESHIEETDSVLQDLDSTLDKSPIEANPAPSVPVTQGLKRKSDEGGVKNGTHKKIVLNKNSSNAPASAPAKITTTEENKTKTVIKLSELSAQERLEMRAKKFGMPLSGDAKKEARAERFGVQKNSTTNNSKEKEKNTPITAAAPASADVLKQRAERFGVKVSTTLTKLENQEKMEKRKARFGANTSNGSSLTNADKAQQRLERFKQPVK